MGFGIHDQKDQAVVKVAILRRIFNDAGRQPVEMHRSRNRIADRDRELYIGEALGPLALQRLAEFFSADIGTEAKECHSPGLWTAVSMIVTCCVSSRCAENLKRYGSSAMATAANYSPVSNIGDIGSLEEGSDEGSVVLDID